MICKNIKVNEIITKSSLPLGGYSANPYLGCSHGCKYCYASFMKRFTHHLEPWGEFIDVKEWHPIKNKQKYNGKKIVIGSVTDGYIKEEETYRRTRHLLEELVDCDCEIIICTKSDLVLRDLDLIKRFKKITVSWSINTLDENFKNDMDHAPSISSRLNAMKVIYSHGIRTVCFISPIFPGITDFEAIFNKVKDQCDLVWLENLNLRGSFKQTIMQYIKEKHHELIPLYEDIYNKHNNDYWVKEEQKAKQLAEVNFCKYVDNEMPYERSPIGHPAIVNFFFHEQIKNSNNSGIRKI